MQDIKIFFSSADRVEPDEIIEMQGPRIDVDFSALRKHYESLGEKHIKNIDKFTNKWSEEWEGELFVPKARISVMPKKEAHKDFGDELFKGDELVDIVITMIWTIGDALEKKSADLISGNKDVMMGFLLDVAGSIALYNMHDALMGWVRSKLAPERNEFITREFYPGFDNIACGMLSAIERVIGTDIIGVRSRGSSMFNPRKTQYSFVGLSPTDGETSVTVLPCAPCSGKKCLYYQLGGCHMQIMAAANPDSKIF